MLRSGKPHRSIILYSVSYHPAGSIVNPKSLDHPCFFIDFCFINSTLICSPYDCIIEMILIRKGVIMNNEDRNTKPNKTAGEAGWHLSRYNLYASIPDSPNTAVVNLFKSTYTAFNPMEMYLLSVLDELSETHPMISRFSEKGVIANFDEYAALETLGKLGSADHRNAYITICPTMACNFDCPYCFEEHGSGKMTPEIQEHVIRFIEHLLSSSHTEFLKITWFGGEPLLAPDVIEALSERIMLICEKLNVTYTAMLITNGYLLDQNMVDLMERCHVDTCQITLDGLGATHDATRRLAGGGATFDRITDNLRNCSFPFNIILRHNVHEGNKQETEPLREYIRTLARESGNHIHLSPAIVLANPVSGERSDRVDLLCTEDAADVELSLELVSLRFPSGVYCGAQRLLHMGIDEEGNLYKCWECLDKKQLAFGNVKTWLPENPIGTAAHPNLFIRYMNSIDQSHDEGCRNCVWLPLCAGGCPQARLSGKKRCLPYKDTPEKYVMKIRELYKQQQSLSPICKPASKADPLVSGSTASPAAALPGSSES